MERLSIIRRGLEMAALMLDPENQPPQWSQEEAREVVRRALDALPSVATAATEIGKLEREMQVLFGEELEPTTIGELSHKVNSLAQVVHRGLLLNANAFEA